jgi:hypothetical protein
LKILDEFDAEGKRYYEIRAELALVKDRLTNFKKHGILNSKVDEAFSQAWKNVAVWAKTPQKADDVLRNVCGEVWRGASKAERRAAFDYTSGSDSFNRPLRGYEGNWGTFKGIGKVDVNNEGRADVIKELGGDLQSMIKG